MDSTFELQNRCKDWMDKAFGGDYTLRTLLRKAHIEMQEVGALLAQDKPDLEDVAKEVADVMLALLAMGAVVERDLGVLVRLKLTINEQRKWEKQADGTWQHVEEGERDVEKEDPAVEQVPSEEGPQKNLFV